jgi:LuxR family transcriptional regulator, maltose regulon positive regulatory protein
MKAENLLQTKLYIPSTRPQLLSRPRLLARLENGLAGRLTLISAPAGFGKTTLLLSWLAEARVTTAWLSIDQSDNDVSRFLAYTIAALQCVHPHLGHASLSALASPATPVEAVLTGLLNELAVLEPAREKTVLVIDDYHLITSRPVHEAVRFLLERLPGQLHLVVATREDPPLHLARLRAQNQITEVRARQLRFTPEETAAFLGELMDLDLSMDQVATLAARTEGWIAGLQLAALSLRDQVDRAAFVRAFSGTDRYVMDYLVDEVLSRQPAEVQLFLIQTSILERLSGPLCQAVIDSRQPAADDENGSFFARPDSAFDAQSLLEYLEQANLFVVSLDNHRVWYRYHHLFAELLRARLKRTLPDKAPALYLRAANWCERQGLLHEAMNYALAAADWELAAGWLEQYALVFLGRGEMATLLNWIAVLPQETARHRPRLSLELAWLLTYANRLEEVEPLLRSTEIALESGSGSDSHPSAYLSQVDKRVIQANVALVRAYLALTAGKPAQAIELAQQAGELLPPDDPAATSHIRELVYLHWVHGYAHRMLGDLFQAVDFLTKAVELSQASGEIWHRMVAMTDLGIAYRQRGRLNKAAGLFRQILQLAGDNTVAGHGYLSRVEGHLATVLLEQNKVEEALYHARRGVEWMQGWPSHNHVAAAHAVLARVQMACRDLQGAASSLEQADRARQGVKVLPVVDSLVDTGQVRLWLHEGNLDPAESWADEFRRVLGESAQPGQFTDESLEARFIALARFLLAKGRQKSEVACVEEALPLLDRLQEGAQNGGRIHSVIEIGVLQSVALSLRAALQPQVAAHAGADTGELEPLAKVLQLAEDEDYVQVFVDEGQPMAEMLYRAAAQGIAPDYGRKLLAAFPIEGNQRQVGRTAEPRAVASEVEGLIELLSDRETEVLQLIAEGLSNSEIAQRLYLSLNTVKGHTRNIYGKLNVNSRTQAVARARAFGLLPPE